MSLVIGFATEFYTLWDVTKEDTYITDASGNHHRSGTIYHYCYIKNISTDIEKAKAAYPNAPIDEELRGIHTRTHTVKKEDLPQGFFWAGKYSGMPIDEILQSDIKYCDWCIKNYPNSDSSKYIAASYEYAAFIAEKEAEEQRLINESGCVPLGIVELDFTSNGFNLDSDNSCAARAMYGQTTVYVNIPSCKQVFGMYPYIMPAINGKPQKTKNKTIAVEVISVDKPQVVYSYGRMEVVQSIKIK